MLPFSKFSSKARSPYHVNVLATEMLSANNQAQFHRLEIQNQLKVENGKNYFCELDHCNIVMMSFGKTWSPHNGFSIITTNTDFVTFKPTSNLLSQNAIEPELHGDIQWSTFINKEFYLSGSVDYEKPGSQPTNAIVTFDSILKLEGNSSNVNSLQFKWLDESMQNLEVSNFKDLLCYLMQHKTVDPSDNFSAINIIDFDLYFTMKDISSISEDHMVGSRLDNNINCFNAIKSLVNFSNELQEDSNFCNIVYLFYGAQCKDNEAIKRASKRLQYFLSRLTKVSTFSSNKHFFEKSIGNSILIVLGQFETTSVEELMKKVVIKKNDHVYLDKGNLAGLVLNKCLEQKGVESLSYEKVYENVSSNCIGSILSGELLVPTVDVAIVMGEDRTSREMVHKASLNRGLEICEAFLQKSCKMRIKSLLFI